MNKAAISARNISKSYRLGVQDNRADTFQGLITGLAKAPFNRLKKLREHHSEADDAFWALRDVSFEVQAGEVVGIIGRNGAGKSTLLKILSRITEPTEGDVFLRGRLSSLLEVGTGFHQELTGRENIYLNGSILGMSKAEIKLKFDDIVAFSGVEKFLDTPVKRYSSGMYVRLAFAVAAHLEPEILIVDEVLAVGDIAFQKKCLAKMESVADSGRTVLFVSHNMPAVQTLCKSAIRLESGRIVDKGDAHTVVAKYLHDQYGNLSAVFDEIRGHGIEGSGLIHAAILNSSGNVKERLFFKEQFKIRMIWRHGKKVDSLSYTIRVFSDEDRLVFAVNTIGYEELDIGKSDKEVIECKIDNLLAPGNYRVEISAWVRPHTQLYKKDDCLSFSIENVPLADEKPYTIVGDPVFVPNISWCIC